MTTKSSLKFEVGAAAFILLGAVAWGFFILSPAKAADNQGAYTNLNAVAEGYVANAETAAFVTLDGTDTLTGLEDPVAKFGLPRIFRLRDTTGSASLGTKPNLKIQLKFSVALATANVWVAYYYVNPAAPTVYHLTAVSRPLGGTMAATAAQEGALFLSLAEVEDGFAATHCVVFSDSISAGTAALWLGSY